MQKKCDRCNVVASIKMHNYQIIPVMLIIIYRFLDYQLLSQCLHLLKEKELLKDLFKMISCY